MIRALTTLLGAIATISACSTGNTTCLDVTLWDYFGDGWDGAQLFIEFPDGTVGFDSPTCERNPVHRTVCASTDGVYYMVNQHQNNTLPEEWWEIFWTVSVDYCDASKTDLFYTGGFNSTMVWEYDADTDDWSVAFFDNIWPNEDTCDACGDAKKCKPKPKNKKPKKSPKKGDDKTAATDSTTTNSTTTDSTTTDSTSTDSTDMDGPKYGPPAVDVRVTMYDEEGDGWFMSDYHGANWYISDSTRTKLFFSGTLCDGFNGQCRICLGDGSYVFRVTGDMDNFTSWDFCTVTGNYQDELTFHVKKGKCIPDVIRNYTEVCRDMGYAVVSAVGSFALTGMPSELFDASDASVLFNAISAEVSGFNVADMTLVSSVLDSKSSFSEERKLSTYTHDVTFTVKFDARSFGTDGLIYSELQSVVENIRELLSEKVDSGEFLSALVGKANTLNVPLMASVQGAELMSFDIDTITYAGAEEFVYSTLVFDDEDHSSVVYQSKYDMVSVGIFFSALAVGFIAFVGIMSKGMSGYQNVPQESHHGADVAEVMPSESEHIVTHKFSKFEMGKVEATI